MEQRATKWQLAGAYLGGTIGAGFASGREHLQFFLAYGKDGYLGVALAGGLLALFGGALLSLAYRHQTRSHSDLLRAIAPPGLVLLFDCVLCLVTLTSVSVMMAGGAALFEQAGAGAPLGAVAMGASAALIVALGFVKMLRINGAITAVLTAFIAWVGFAAATQPHAAPLMARAAGIDWTPGAWYGAAALYGAYNITFSFALFGALGSGIRAAPDARFGGIAGGIALGALSFVVCLAVETALPEAAASDVPMLMVVERMGNWPTRLYVVSVWLAMLTTAVTGVYTLARRAESWSRLPLGLCGFAVALAAFPLALLGFQFLVATLYPLAGYVGLGCVAVALLARGAARRI